MNKVLCILVMGALLLALSAILSALVLGPSQGLLVPWLIGFAIFVVAVAVARRALTPRRSWGILAAVNGGMCWAVVLAVSTQSFPEWAPYREGVPSSGVDLTVPVSGIFRVALASGYLGIVAALIGIILIVAAGWLLSEQGGVRHSHR